MEDAGRSEPVAPGRSFRKRRARRIAMVMSIGALAALGYFAWAGDWMHAFGSAAARPVGPGPAAGVAPPRTDPQSVPMDLHILVDQFGYRPQDPKVAVIRSPRVGFDVARGFVPGRADYEVRKASDDEVVLAGPLVPWNDGAVQDSSGDVGWWFDFSALSAPGRYYVFDPERRVRSAAFEIGPRVYHDLLRIVSRTYFYQRSAFDKKAPFADACWVDAAAYVGPGQDREARSVDHQDDASSARDLSGGWFDAGDTNQYVTEATRAVHPLLTAFESFPDGFGDDFGIPESGNGIPDLLDEVRWEIDWLKKMQRPDGASLLKLGVLGHGWASPPSSDKRPRFYVPECTSATIASAGMMAHAAAVFGRFPALAADAADLTARAIRGFDHFVAAKAPQTECDDQRVASGDADRGVPEQSDMAVEAAVYLFARTGDKRFHDHVAKHYRGTQPYRDFGWSRYEPNIGTALLYFARLPDTDPALSKRILADKLADARDGNDVYGFSNQDLYRNYLHREQYHWGSNGMRVAYANSNLAMNRVGLDPERASSYHARALETLHYLHGVNPFGLVYISNMYRHGASYSLNEIYHFWFAPESRWANALTSACGPPPGFLVGGPNAGAQELGVPANLQPPCGQPPQKSYRDWNQTWPEMSYTMTEPSNGYQANYLWLLASLLGEISEAGTPAPP